MTSAYQLQSSSKVLESIVVATSGWKIVYQIDERYQVEDIIAYAMIRSEIYYELIPLTLPDLHLCQTLQEYSLKDGYIGLINPQNEFIFNHALQEEQKDFDFQEIKVALKKNRVKLD